MADCTCAMVRSTAALLNLRFASAMRTMGKPASADQLSKGAAIRLEAINAEWEIKSRRFTG
jgi:hypothetical protein